MQPLVTKPLSLPQIPAGGPCPYCAGNGYIVVKSGNTIQQVQCTHCISTKSQLVTK